jgi:hypothetical protein
VIVRAIAVATLLAFSLSAAPRLTVGPEIEVGRSELVVPQPTFNRAAMATDGDTIFVAHTFGAVLFGTLIDRSSKVLTPKPIVLLAPLAGQGVQPDTDPHVLAYSGHYLVFFRTTGANVDVLRVTRDGEVVERVALPVRLDWRMQFDVATDGTEIVLVHAEAKLLRLGSDLQPLGTMELFTPQYLHGAAARGVAYGDGRFAVVTAYRDRVLTQFLENGVLSPAMAVSEANSDRTGVVRVAWTGASFVTAWTECADTSGYDRLCLGLWAPLTAAGHAQGPVRVLGSSRLASSLSYGYDITLTALDEQTIFFTWREADQQVAMGRRYHLSGAPVGPAANFGVGPLASLRTDDGVLAVFDSRRRLAWIESPALATLPPEIPLAPAVLAPPSESVLAATASAREIAVVRRVYNGAVFDTEISIASHDGDALRTIPVGEAVKAAIASDGDQFFALTNRWLGPLTFEVVGSSKRVQLAARGSSQCLVWTGEELLAVWYEDSRFLLARLDRDGRLLAMPAVLDASHVTSLVARDGRVLLGIFKGNLTSVIVLDAHGNRIGGTDDLRGMNPYGGLALATDGETDALAGVTSDFSDLVLAFRPRQGTFVKTPMTPEDPPPARLTNDSVAMASTREGFVVAFVEYGSILPTTHVALVDHDGRGVRSIELPPGAGGTIALVETAPARLHLVYTRNVIEPAYAGMPRVFARTITVESLDREGLVPLQPRRP